MQAFKSLWKPRGNIAIPQYDISDGVDLQVKAMLYIFKRFAIAKSSDKLERHSLEGISPEDTENLDKLYNIVRFEDVVFNDAHRVLVDWPKNRFRAMLILAHMPQMEHLPQLGESHYRFTILEADASSDEYIRTLSRSDIYIEHNLPLEIRQEIAASVVRKLNPDNLEGRQAAILEYLHLVATEIQVARIYKAMMNKISPQHSPSHSPNHSPHHSPSHSPSHSPVHSRSSSPVRGGAGGNASPPRPPSPMRSRFPKVAAPQSTAPKLSASPPKLNVPYANTPHTPHVSTSPVGSPTLSGSPNPPGSPGSPGSPGHRLRLKTSQTNLKLANVPNLSSNASDSAMLHSMDAGKKHILQQARLAVKSRIEKEQKAIKQKSG